MDDSRNNIQQYINAYITTLKSYGVGDIEIRIGRYSELKDITDDLRNPSHTRWFWLGSSDLNGKYNSVFQIDYDGHIFSTPTNSNDCACVRPIIVISK